MAIVRGDGTAAPFLAQTNDQGTLRLVANDSIFSLQLYAVDALQPLCFLVPASPRMSKLGIAKICIRVLFSKDKLKLFDRGVIDIRMGRFPLKQIQLWKKGISTCRKVPEVKSDSYQCYP